MNRTNLSAAERDFRSRLAQLAHDNWLLRGTLSVRSRKCGKATCHCANGELHASLYLVQSHDGKPRQLCIPKSWEPRVRQAVNDYQQLQRLIEEVSEPRMEAHAGEENAGTLRAYFIVSFAMPRRCLTFPARYSTKLPTGVSNPEHPPP